MTDDLRLPEAVVTESGPDEPRARDGGNLPVPVETVDPSTGEIVIAQPEVAISDTDPLSLPLFRGATALKLTETEKAVLFRPPGAYEVQEKDGGIVYVSGDVIRSRLLEAFGAEWALIPLQKPYLEGNLIGWHGALYVRGHFISDAVGGQVYRANDRINWFDAVEGAKTDCLTKCAKYLVFGLQILWNKAWITEWKAGKARQPAQEARKAPPPPPRASQPPPARPAAPQAPSAAPAAPVPAPKPASMFSMAKLQENTRAAIFAVGREKGYEEEVLRKIVGAHFRPIHTMNEQQGREALEWVRSLSEATDEP